MSQPLPQPGPEPCDNENKIHFTITPVSTTFDSLSTLPDKNSPVSDLDNQASLLEQRSRLESSPHMDSRSHVKEEDSQLRDEGISNTPVRSKKITLDLSGSTSRVEDHLPLHEQGNKMKRISSFSKKSET